MAKKWWLWALLALSSLSASAQIEITDSHGKYQFKQPPKRVVVLNWALAEQMLELSETPTGIADIKGFRRHASKPSVPSSVVDVGDRLSPKFDVIRKLKPDIIMIGYSQRSLLRPLSNIATVVYFKNFGQRYDNHSKSRSRFLEIAKLFDKTKMAKRILERRDMRLMELKQSLRDSLANRKLPSVLFVVPGAKKYWVFGKNSMPYYAAQALGLNVLSSQDNDQFGSDRLSLDELVQLGQNADGPVCRLYLSSYAADLEPVGDKLPCVAELDYQNVFGGVMSIQYLAESIHQALIK